MAYTVEAAFDQAVTLYYKTWPNVDIVPVSVTYVQGTDQSVDHYNVPDSNTDTWIKSRPRKHASTIEAKSTECGQNCRRIIKMVKHWNRTHSEYLQSFHLEVLAVSFFGGQLADLPWNVYQFFDKACSSLAQRLYYEVGYVDDYLDATARNEAYKRLATARDLAQTSLPHLRVESKN